MPHDHCPTLPPFPAQLADALSRVTYKPGWTIAHGTSATMGHFLRVKYDGTGAYGSTPWTGRRWPIAAQMTRSEAVNTALKAVLAAEEHEARECFRFCGVDVYSPHHSVDDLAALRVADRLTLDVRADAMQGA